MAQEEKKKKNRLRYMILSVIIAVIAWGVVTYTTDPDITKTFTGVRVEITGEDVLTENGYVVAEREAIPKMSVKLRGKRSDLINALGKTKVVIDVSAIRKAGAYDLEGTARVPSSRIYIEKILQPTAPITVAELETKDVPLRITQTGSLDGKLVKSVPEKDTITIKGAKYELDMVEAAEVTVNVSEVTDSSAAKLGYSLVLTDNFPREDLTTLRITENVAVINNTIYNAKEVPVKIKLKDDVKSGLNGEETKLEPKTVTVGVKDDTNIEYVTVTLGENAGEGEYKIDKTEGVYIPENVRTVTINPSWKKQ